VRTRLALGCAGIALSLAGALTACTGGGPASPATTSPTSHSTEPASLTIAVYGAPSEVAAYQRIVDNWNARHPTQHLILRATADRDAQRADLTDGGALPDLFLTSRRELGWLLEHQANQPVGELLDERGVNFGDDFQRDAILAFSAQEDLQCMPWGVSPMVIYYNTRLVDFDTMRALGLDVPDDHESWTFDQFRVAAEAATDAGARGVQIDRTLRGLAPFIYSGGGRIFDNDVQPTALAFESSDTMAALQKTLPLLRNPLVTLTDRQLQQATPLEWFKRGRLGMIEGFRSMTPELRAVPGLHFDVLPMPTVNSSKTIGDISGFCVSATASNPQVAADVLQFLSEPYNVAQVTRAGYLVPANVEVAESVDFLQPDQEPAHAAVFNQAVPTIINPPLLDSYAELDQAVAPEFAQLFATGVLDLPTVAKAIDAAAAPVLATLLPSPTPEG
jgi:multiple sugar transport system substrate-binding protein